jgi:hypothetical protein
MTVSVPVVTFRRTSWVTAIESWTHVIRKNAISLPSSDHAGSSGGSTTPGLPAVSVWLLDPSALTICRRFNGPRLSACANASWVPSGDHAGGTAP